MTSSFVGSLETSLWSLHNLNFSVFSQREREREITFSSPVVKVCLRSSFLFLSFFRRYTFFVSSRPFSPVAFHVNLAVIIAYIEAAVERVWKTCLICFNALSVICVIIVWRVQKELCYFVLQIHINCSLRIIPSSNSFSIKSEENPGI